MIPKNTFYFTCLSGTRRHMLILKNTFNRTQVRSLELTDSVTHSLTNSCLVNLIDLTLACEDAYSKLVEVVTVADVDDENHVGNSLLQIWELRIVHKAKLLFRL